MTTIGRAVCVSQGDLTVLVRDTSSACLCNGCGLPGDTLAVEVDGPVIQHTNPDSRVTYWCAGCLASALAIRLMAQHARETGELPTAPTGLRRIQ